MPKKEVYWTNPEKFRKATNQYRLDNPEWHREANREWVAKQRAENPDFKEREKSAGRKYRKANQQKRQDATTKWARSKPGYWLFKNAQYRAKRDGVPFSITFEDITIPDVCPVLGIPIFFGEKRKGFQPNSPSIDKIIPSLGYVKGNICVISNRANCIKRDATLEELRRVTAYVERQTKPTVHWGPNHVPVIDPGW